MKVLVMFDGSLYAEAILEKLGWLKGIPGAEVVLAQVLEGREVRAALQGGHLATDFAFWTVGATYGPDGGLLPMPGPSLADPRFGMPQYPEYLTQVEDRAIHEAKDYLDGMAKRLDGMRVKTMVRMDGDVAQSIIDLAKAEDASFIAMTTHGRTGLLRTIVGSVAEEVVKMSEVPVLLYRPRGVGEQAERESAGAGKRLGVGTL